MNRQQFIIIALFTAAETYFFNEAWMTGRYIIETMVNTGRMDWADVARVMSTVPAQIGRVESQGRGLVVGAPAHVTLVDATVRVTVDPAKQWTRSTNCPFRGMELPGQVRYTIFGGVPTVVDATWQPTEIKYCGI